MTDWLRRARLEIPKGPPRPTANRAVRTVETVNPVLTSLSAVPHPAPCGGDDPFSGIATVQEEAEIRALLDRECGRDHPDYPEALAVALRDPGAALDALRGAA